MATTTAICTSFKSDVMSALMCFNAIVTPTATTATSFVLTSLSAMTGVAVGMSVSGTNVAAGSVVASIDSATQVTVSKATTGSGSGITMTITGDTFKLALIKVGPAGTYGAASTNYTDITGNSDEASGTNYTAGGNSLTNISPTTSGTTSFVDFSDTSWTTATFSTTAAMIYNSSRRGPTATRACSTHDFGGTQSVTAGTFTIVFPTADASNAILRIG